MNRAPSPWVACILLTLGSLFWAGNWIAGRAIADLVPPVAMTFWRWIVALALVAPIVGPRLWASRALIAREWRPIVVLGLLGGGLHNILQYWGLRYTTATNGTILNCLTPIFIIVLGALLFRQRFPARTALGAAVSLAGALAIVSRLDASVVARLDFNAGDLLIILSMVMLAGYTVALRWRPQGLDALSFLACFALVAEVPVGLAYAAEHLSGAHVVLNWRSALGLAYVGIFPALLAYHFWNLGVAAIGPARAAVFLYLMPFFGAVLGATLLGEQLGAYHAIGAALIIAGVTIASRNA